MFVDGSEKSQPGLSTSPRDKSDLDQNKVVRIPQAQETRRMNVPVRRQNVVDAEIVLRRYSKRLFQSGLDRISQLGQACIIVTAFVDVDLGYRHCTISFKSSLIRTGALTCRALLTDGVGLSAPCSSNGPVAGQLATFRVN